MGPSALLCPGACDAVKMALFIILDQSNFIDWWNVCHMQSITKIYSFSGSLLVLHVEQMVRKSNCIVQDMIEKTFKIN